MRAHQRRFGSTVAGTVAGSVCGVAALLMPCQQAVASGTQAQQRSSAHVTLTMLAPDGHVLNEVSAGRGPADVHCFVKPTNPHWSRGAGSVIYKTYVNCVGTLPQVVVRVQGKLDSISGVNGPRPPLGPPVPRTTSNEAQAIPIGAKAVPFYTPPQGIIKVRGSAWYRGTSTAQITSPGLSNLGTISTARVFVTSG